MHSIRIFYIFIISSFWSYAQNDELIQIDYLYSYDVMSTKARLLANDSKAVYIKFSVDTIIHSKIDDGGISTMGKTDIKLDRMRFFSYIQHDTVVSEMSGYENNKYIVIDKVPQQNWLLDTDSKKEIAGYICNKATLNYRGREFEAFYSPDIPLRFGPFKFKGLPGAILEVKAINGSDLHLWKAIKIKKVKCDDCNDYFEVDYEGRVEVSQKDYVESIEQYVMNIFKRYNTREAQRGVTSKSTMSRQGVEILYEWESK